jgi:hypothetical protein
LRVHPITYVVARVLNDDHGAVVQVAHSLPLFLARLLDLESERFTRQEGRLESGGDLVQVDCTSPTDLGDLGQVVVDSDHCRVHVFR